MKKLFALITAAMLSLATLSSTYATPLNAFYQQHLKKDGTADKRFKDNKESKHLTKSGKPDMRYKSNNPNAGKKKKS